MRLSPDEYELFYKLYPPLLLCANNKNKILSKTFDLDGFFDMPLDEKKKLRDALYGNLELIDSFVKENIHNFSTSELDIISSWKHLILGKFYVLRNLKKYFIFLSYQDTQQVETTQQVSASAQRRGKKQISHQVTPQDTQQVEATQQVSPSAQRRGKKQISQQVTPQDTQQVEATPQVSKLIAQRADITDKRAMTLKLCGSPRTLKEIMSFLGLKDRNNFTGKILNPLLQSNYILRTIPGKPKSRLQKYVTNISNRVSGPRSEF